MSYFNSQTCECGCRLTLSRMIDSGGVCPDCGEVYFTIEVDKDAPPIERKDIEFEPDAYGYPHDWWGF